MRTRRLLAVSAAALLALTSLAACGDDDDASTAGTESATPPVAECSADVTTGPDASGEFGSEPAIAAPEGAPPCELLVEDRVEGKGKAVSDISKVYLWNYEGVSWSTGEKFDSSFDRGAPAPFPLEQVIPGWTEGLQGMKPGGRRQLVIPPDQAYGATGRPGIAPNETLVFVVDLVGLPEDAS